MNKVHMNIEMKTKETMLNRLQNTEVSERSWDDFVEYYELYIFNVISNFGVKAKDCEDLVQDVLVKVWKAIPKYSYNKNKCRFRTWLYIIIRNAVYNFTCLKASKNSKKNVSYDLLKENLDLQINSEVEQIAENEWKVYISNMAWNNLKEKFPQVNRQIFEASLNEENNNLLAKRFAVAESSVRVYKMRIRKALHKEIIRLNRELGG